jgi:tripartite-type tricarboxylate transporter receptor subunit TctC
MKIAIPMRFVSRRLSLRSSAFFASLRLIAVLGMVACNAFAEYPDRPIRYIVPSAAGGSPDITARALTAELGRQMGQQFVVDNRPGGASGTIGTEMIARAAPDGYTIGQGLAPAMSIMRTLLPKLSYNPELDLQPIVQVYFTPNLLAVAPSLPVKSVQELIGYAKKNPDTLLFASSGSGSTFHISAELFKLMTGTRMIHVPYKGVQLAIPDLAAGRVHVMFDSVASIGPHVKAGRVRGLAVTSLKRSQAFPELPTVSEAGVPGFEVISWAGVIAPAKTPKAIVTRLNAEVNKAIASPQVREKFTALGYEVVGGTSEQFAAHIKRETAKWADVVKRAGVKID